MTLPTELRVPAIRIRQGRKREVFSFAVDGKDLHRFAAVSRVHRGGGGSLGGYQRPEVMAHVGAIRSYLESAAPILPNALVVAFDKRVRFLAAGDEESAAQAEIGELVIPLADDADEWDKPGWIVDGQQRAAALRDAKVRRFPIFVSAFIARSDAEQRSQFILVNATKPLPKGLIHELLPTADGLLPPALRKKKFPALLVERLNFDDDSPLRFRIRTPTQPDGIIKDTAVLKVIEHSLSDGALHAFRDPETGRGHVERMLDVLKAFFEAVDLIFPEAWNSTPRRSRLVHGAGIVAMGFLMDATRVPPEGDREELVGVYAVALSAVAPSCAWTSGVWEFSGDDRRAWNAVQNTPRDIDLLSDFLVRMYVQGSAQ